MEENHESQDTSAVTPDQEQARAHWRDRFEKQATARMQTLRECAEELYGQAMFVGRRKDTTYALAVPGVWAKNFSTVRDAGLGITEPAIHAKILLGLLPKAEPSTMDAADTLGGGIPGVAEAIAADERPREVFFDVGSIVSRMPGVQFTATEDVRAASRKAEEAGAERPSPVREEIAIVLKTMGMYVVQLAKEAEGKIHSILGAHPSMKVHVGIELDRRYDHNNEDPEMGFSIGIE